jgi:hypothetical protein
MGHLLLEPGQERPLSSSERCVTLERAFSFVRTSVCGLPRRTMVCVTGKSWRSITPWMWRRRSLAKGHAWWNTPTASRR